LDSLARRNARRFHVIDKPIDPRITVQALDVGIDLRLSSPPSRVRGILGVEASYTFGERWGGHGLILLGAAYHENSAQSKDCKRWQPLPDSPSLRA
jgi:hypothetical protein